jgi:hypothetical protein
MEAEKWDMDGEPKDERNQSKGQRTKTMWQSTTSKIHHLKGLG